MCVSQIKELKGDDSIETIAKAVAAIAPNFHRFGKDSITLVNEPLLHNKLKSQTDEIVTAILRRLHSFGPVMRLDGIKSTTSVGSRISNVIVVDSYVSFRKIFVKMNTKFEGYQGLFLVVLTSKTNKFSQMKSILEDFWSSYLMRVNVVLLKSPEEAEIFTFFPYTATSCGEVHPVLLDTYVNGQGFVEHKQMVPAKTRNLYQCPMKIAAVNFPPFVIDRKNRTGINKFSGIDALVLRTLAVVMNFTLDVDIIDDKEKWGELQENGNSSGAIEKIMNRGANITAGFFIFNEVRNKFMTPSTTYYTTTLVWIVNSGDTISIFQRLYKPFGPHIWYLVLAYLAIGFIFITLIERTSNSVRNFVFGRQVRSPTLQMVNILLGGVMNHSPTRNFARYLLALYLFYCFVLRSAYIEALYRFMRSDDLNQRVETMDDMLEQNYTFLVPDVFEDNLEQFPDVIEKTIFLNGSEYETGRQRIQNSDEKLALLTTRDEVGYWNMKLQTGKKFVYLEEVAFNVNLVFYMHKQTIFTYEINRILDWLNSNGYMEALDDHYKSIYDPQKNFSSGPKKLSIEHLTGVFYILQFGLVASVIGFFIELMIEKYLKQKSCHAFMR